MIIVTAFGWGGCKACFTGCSGGAAAAGRSKEGIQPLPLRKALSYRIRLDKERGVLRRRLCGKPSCYGVGWSLDGSWRDRSGLLVVEQQFVEL